MSPLTLPVVCMEKERDGVSELTEKRMGTQGIGEIVSLRAEKLQIAPRNWAFSDFLREDSRLWTGVILKCKSGWPFGRGAMLKSAKQIQ